MPITYGFLIHNSQPKTRVYRLEFVDREYYLAWIQSETVRPVGGFYNDGAKMASGSKAESGYVDDETEFPIHPTEANVVVMYTDETGNSYVAKLFIKDPMKVLLWMEELSRQPRNTSGPGRPPRRWLEMTDYRSRVPKRLW